MAFLGSHFLVPYKPMSFGNSPNPHHWLLPKGLGTPMSTVSGHRLPDCPPAPYRPFLNPSHTYLLLSLSVLQPTTPCSEVEGVSTQTF